MIQKNKLIFTKSMNIHERTIAEGIVNTIGGIVKNKLSGYAKTHTIKQVLPWLRRLQKLGIKQVSGQDIQRAIADLERFAGGEGDAPEDLKIGKWLKDLPPTVNRTTSAPVVKESKYTLESFYNSDENDTKEENLDPWVLATVKIN